VEVVFRLPGDSSPELKLIQNPLSGHSRIFVDGVEVQPERRGRMRVFAVTLGDGSKAELQLRNSGLDVLPRANLVSGDPPEAIPIQLARPLAWWEYALSALPLLLIAVGGALGGLTGALAAYLNLRLMRTNLSAPLRALAAVGVAIAALFVYLAVATVIFLAIGPR
jgi:hypothetical protein